LTTISFEIYIISNEIDIKNRTMELSLYSTQPQFNTPEVFKTPIIQQPVKPTNPNTSIEQVLHNIFPEKTEENKITRTRILLGETAKTLTSEQIECINAEYQFLIDTWLDEFEKSVFEGMTLKEVLNGV